MLVLFFFIVFQAGQFSGKGMQMQYDDGRTTITCLCESPMFVQAPLHAKRLNDDTATVYRLSGVAEGDDVDSELEIFRKFLTEHRLYQQFS